MFDRIVAVVDGSEKSNYVIGESVTIAREDRDILTFCISIDPALTVDRIGPTSFEDLATELSQRMLDDAVRTAHSGGLPDATGTILQGLEAHAVVDFARTQNAGLIVLRLRSAPWAIALVHSQRSRRAAPRNDDSAMCSTSSDSWDVKSEDPCTDRG